MAGRDVGWIVSRQSAMPASASGAGLAFPANDWSFAAHDVEAAARVARGASWTAVVTSGFNLGSSDAIDFDAVARLGALAEAVGAAWIGDEIAWNGIDDRVWRAPLPLPRTHRVATHVAERCRVVGDVLGRELLLGNVARAGRFPDPTELDEADFLLATAEAAGCGLTLDLAALRTTAASDGVPADGLLARLPAAMVRALLLRGVPAAGDAEWRALLAAAADRFPAAPLLADPAALAGWPEPLASPAGGGR
jgi:uncharacterized protein (UPF0276 family)